MTWLIEMWAEGRQASLLGNEKQAKEDFEKLDEDVKDCYNWDKILQSMKY